MDKKYQLFRNSQIYLCQTNRQTNRQTGKQANRQTGKIMILSILMCNRNYDNFFKKYQITATLKDSHTKPSQNHPHSV